MSRKRSESQKNNYRVDVRRRRRAIVVLATLVALTLTSVMMAQKASLRTLLSPATIATPAPAAPQSSPALAKEYVYAGGRLIATEEPGSSSPLSPSISFLSPTTGVPGQAAFTLTIVGTNLAGATSINFSPAIHIGISGISSSSSQVSATILINSAATLGTRNVSVTTANGTSNSLFFEVDDNPLPVLSGISPTTVTAGGGNFQLAVSGSGFIASSVVRVNGIPRTTTFNSNSLLTATILAGDISAIGTKNITVFNPTPGGGESNPKTLFINSAAANPVPFISAISPLNVAEDGPQFELTVTSNTATFVNGAEVRIGASPRTTTFINTGELRAQILASDITTSGPKAITVFNPPSTSGMGGGISNTVNLNVTSGAPQSGTGLQGQYFNNKDLTGTPAVTRIDPTINFAWKEGSPAPGINVDQFSVRWTGQVQALTGGTYTFFTVTNDGVRLWVNNQQLINKWVDQAGVEWSNTITLQAGQRYDITMEFYDNINKASAQLLWKQAGSIHKQIIPTSQLFPPATSNPPPPVPPLFQGAHEATNCTNISGWAADRNRPNVSINVDIYNGSTLLATVPANQFHAGSQQIVGDNGLHGFSYTVPASLKDGLLHSISVKYSSTTSNLAGSPQTLICSGTVAPLAPSGLVATVVSPTQVDLRWTDNSANEDGFRIDRKIGAGGTYVIDYATRFAGVTTFSDLQVSAGNTYVYRVRAFNGAGPSAYSSEVSITVSGGGSSGPPSSPSNLIVTVVSASKINLSWTDNSNNETGFRVFRSKPGSTTTFTVIKTTNPNETTFEDPGLTSSTNYCYKITARNAFGDSPSTPVVCATTSAGLAPKPAVDLLSGGGGQFNDGYIEGDTTTARWNNPSAGAVGIDPVSGLKVMFITDSGNHRIRLIYLDGPARGNSMLVAGGAGAGYWDGDGDPYAARYNFPRGIAVITNSDGVIDAVLIADTDNHVIRMLLPPLGGTNWRPSVFAGKGEPDYVDGLAADVFFNSPYSVAVGSDDSVYVADTGNGAIRRLDLEGNASTYFKATQHLGSVFNPYSVATDELSPWVYIGVRSSHSINRVGSGVIETLAGTGSAGFANGIGTLAAFALPHELIVSYDEGSPILLLADAGNNRIRKLALSNIDVTSQAGSGVAGYLNNSIGDNARFRSPTGIAKGVTFETYVIDQSNHSIRVMKQ